MKGSPPFIYKQNKNIRSKQKRISLFLFTYVFIRVIIYSRGEWIEVL